MQLLHSSHCIPLFETIVLKIWFLLALFTVPLRSASPYTVTALCCWGGSYSPWNWFIYASRTVDIFRLCAQSWVSSRYLLNFMLIDEKRYSSDNFFTLKIFGKLTTPLIKALLLMRIEIEEYEEPKMYL